MEEEYEQRKKYRITNDYMMIVGKYFDSYKDFCNVTKVCKMYNKLIDCYKFNPVEDPMNLFSNKQTQYFYSMDEYVRSHVPYRYYFCTVISFDVNCGVYNYINNFTHNCRFIKDVILDKEYSDMGFTLDEDSAIINDNVTVINDEAFFGLMTAKVHTKKKVIIPEGVRKINSQAFASSIIETLRVPSTVTYIGGDAFRYCSHLKDVLFKTTMMSVFPEQMFLGCKSLVSVVIPEGVLIILNGCFRNCESLKIVEFPSTLLSIGDSAFKNTGVKVFKLPNSILNLGVKCMDTAGDIDRINIPKSLACFCSVHILTESIIVI